MNSPISGDIIVLLDARAFGALPYVVSAPGGSRAGLRRRCQRPTACCLQSPSALGHDLYYKMVDPNASTVTPGHRVEKSCCSSLPCCAAYLAAQKPANILFLVSAAFSFAAACVLPRAQTLGIFWKRATGIAAVAWHGGRAWALPFTTW
jgi:cation/acetate symporter